VLPVPALVTLALAVLAAAVFDAERVAHPLVAARAGPALLAATGSAHAHPVGPAVHLAHLWKRAGQKQDPGHAHASRQDSKVDAALWVFFAFTFVV